MKCSSDEKEPLIQRDESVDVEPYNETSTEEDETSKKKVIIGILLAFSANILFTANNFIIKLLKVNVSDAVLVRCVIQIIIFSTYTYQKGESFIPQEKIQVLLLCLQGVGGSLAVILSFASVRAIPVLDAMAIIYLSPLITMFLASCMLGDRLTLLKFMSGLVIVSGELLVCQPPFLFPNASTVTGGDSHLLGMGLAFAACLSGSFNAIFVNMLGKKSVPVSVLVSWVAVASLVLASFYSLIVGDSQILSPSIKQLTPYDWMLLIGLSLTGILSFLCVTLSLQMAPPPLIVSVRSMELLCSTVGTVIVTKQMPSWITCLGVFIITGGVLSLTLQKQILKVTNKIAEMWRGSYRRFTWRREEGYEELN